MQLAGGRAEGVDCVDFFRCERTVQFSESGIDDLPHREDADAALALRNYRDVVGRDLRLVGRFFAAPMVREATVEDRY